MYFNFMDRVRKKEIPTVVIQVGIKIKEIIEKKKLKQREVAHDAGLDVENLRKYMKGTQEMKISTLVRISDALNISASELLDDLKPIKS